MSWDCPHLTRDYYCNRLRIKCDPTCKGCVLHGKVTPLTKPPADTTKEVTNVFCVLFFYPFQSVAEFSVFLCAFCVFAVSRFVLTNQPA